MIERLLLPQLCGRNVRIAGPVRLRALAVDDDVRAAVAPKALDGILEFEFGSGSVRAAVGTADVSRERGAEASPKNRDDDLGLARVQDLLLKGAGGSQRLVLPEHRLEMQHVADLSIEPADHAPRDEPLLGHIARR